MTTCDEKWALFWCELLKPLIYGEVAGEQSNQFLKHLAEIEVTYPNGKQGRPSVSTLRRKLNLYTQGGFNSLARKQRSDKGQSRNVDKLVVDAAIELKKDQPHRSDRVINTMLEARFGVTIPKSTLFRHLKLAGATKIKLNVSKQKVRKRWTRENTNDLWVGDFEEGPYVLVGEQVLPTYLSAFIDCHSRYVVEGRYYLRQSLDILIDSLIRAVSVHGVPGEIYVDNAKVYHSQALRAACYRHNIKLIFRPVRDPAAGGLIERLFLTAQNQFEAEVKAGPTLTLDQINRGLTAWLEVQYHQDIHSEVNQTPHQRYKDGLRCQRLVDIQDFLKSFLQRVTRVVNRDFSDIKLNNRYYKVDPRLRRDKVEVRYDPFGALDIVHIHSLHDSSFLGEGKLHNREHGVPALPDANQGHAKYSYIDVLVQEHETKLNHQVAGIDYTKIQQNRPWPFNAFAQKLVQLKGMKSITDFTAFELEKLKKFYNQHPAVTEDILTRAYQKALGNSVSHIIVAIKQLLEEK
jgi:putative transposase